MSSTTHSRSLPRRLRTRLTVLVSALALALYGMLAVAGPAHADDHIQITDSADPVPANIPYDYIVTIPEPLFEGGFGDATIDLSGAAATFTGAVTSNNVSLSCSASGTHASCFPQFNPGNDPITITATVLPTAAGIVTADAELVGMGPLGSASTTTTIGPGGPSGADLSTAVSDTPDPVALGDSFTDTVTVANNGPGAATSVDTSVTYTGAAVSVGSVSSSQGTCTPSGSTVNCSLGSLAASGSATVTVTVEPAATGTVTATATSSAVEDDPTPGNNSDSESTTVNNANGCTITGTGGADTINGTVDSDVICALGGNDTVNADNADDTVYGGAGNDTLNGGNGEDTLNGGDGDDTLNGNNGNDTINAGPGDDTADGGNGTDTCPGTEHPTSCTA
ncbi:hypothetical protein OG453_06175 [Streptomyces sp. NBC_01381]|uniref:calcium-binding protein n=1 Tax=Streptomyces sp. NBC_01381 TaxID=2903845 RepID=UPI002253A4E1|nr:CARDB domain-containing protein [Streptomyces sp. NBC_01381]MCX4666253.1 hypothetical protein [Streptomyces sp. NBC_01381]